jgi:hypothetical protein
MLLVPNRYYTTLGSHLENTKIQSGRHPTRLTDGGFLPVDYEPAVPTAEHERKQPAQKPKRHNQPTWDPMIDEEADSHKNDRNTKENACQLRVAESEFAFHWFNAWQKQERQEYGDARVNSHKAAPSDVFLLQSLLGGFRSRFA